MPNPSLAATGLSTELCSVVMSYAASAAASLVVAGHSPVFFSCSPLMSMNWRPCDGIGIRGTTGTAIHVRRVEHHGKDVGFVGGQPCCRLFENASLNRSQK